MRQDKDKDNSSSPLHQDIGVNAAKPAFTPKCCGVTAKRIFIRTFGCQMNVRDSEAIIGLFLDKGYELTEDAREADVILVNTCSVREHAEHRAISFLGSLKKTCQSTVKDQQSADKNRKIIDHGLSAIDDPQRHKPIVGFIGCAARNRGAEVFSKMPHVNLILGPGWFDKIFDFVERIKDKGERIKELGDKERNELLYSGTYRCEPDSAQVVISTGCNNWCTYCIVPYVRGALRFRKPEDILDEVKCNIDRGFRKITLLGQNVNDYEYRLQVTCHKSSRGNTRDRQEKEYRSHVTGHKSQENEYMSTDHGPQTIVDRPQSADHSRQTTVGFLDILRKVEKIKGLEELYFLSANPKNTSKELLDFMAESDKIKKQLHLPFQSGSNQILKKMGRGYTREWYLELIEYYKQKVGGKLGTDVIVGFPGETDQDFQETKDLMEKIRFDYAYIFKYSPRPHSKAFKLKDDVPLKVKEERHAVLLEMQKRASRARKK